VFEVELAIRGQMRGNGSGRSKKEAEQDAARKLLEALSAVELLTNASSDPLSCPDSGMNVYPQ
jgi:hypothetical protein